LLLPSAAAKPASGIRAETAISPSARRPPARGEQPEGEEGEREDVEEVALLNAVGSVGCIEAGLEDDRQRKERGEDAEGELRARPRPPDRQDEAEDRARREDPAGRVEEQHRVGGGPFPDCEWAELQVEHAPVVTQERIGPGHRKGDEGEREEAKGEPLLPQHEPKAPLTEPERQGAEQEADRQDHELHPREGRQPCEGDERDLRTPGRTGERRDSSGNGG
jgi:hypothetical protein